MEFPSRKRPKFITLYGAVIEDCSSHGNPCLRINNPYRIRGCIRLGKLLTSIQSFINIYNIDGFNRTSTSVVNQVQIYTLAYFLLLPFKANRHIKHKLDGLKSFMLENDDEEVYKEANSLSDYVKLIKNLIKNI